MNEAKAVLGILAISALFFTGYLVMTNGGTGAAVSQTYIACCCNILITEGDQMLIRSQVQTFADDCASACERYSGEGYIFPQQGFCGVNQ